MMRRFAFVLLLATTGCKAAPAEEPARETSSASTANAEAPATSAPPPRSAPPAPGGLTAPPDVAAPPADAQRTASGLASKVLRPGSGTTRPTALARVTVHYSGWTTDGQMFDSSRLRGEPATFPLRGVIPGWTEGLQLMVAGEQRRFWIPVELAYNGQPNMPPGMLVFDVELISFVELPPPPPPPPTPEDVAAPPSTAECAANHLCTRRLAAGRGGPTPSANAMVRIHYSGWTTDGRMFDSSVTRGEPVEFPLARVVPGFSQGIQLMTAGEKRRLWIPQELAYQGRPGAPPGMLVFDVELLEILAP